MIEREKKINMAAKGRGSEEAVFVLKSIKLKVTGVEMNTLPDPPYSVTYEHPKTVNKLLVIIIMVHIGKHLPTATSPFPQPNRNLSVANRLSKLCFVVNVCGWNICSRYGMFNLPYRRPNLVPSLSISGDQSCCKLLPLLRSITN
ncbi:hypothetical protein L2E82_25906 [Cichorium intybus]|uniref:Uncharacterized protein n=1 Tax=Cichorium intybus TaxID=13427 RepID=A0ACB9E4V3_CICIN|nr:hypothetical protein L2E82_25906 [Cichorium intybus]